VTYRGLRFGAIWMCAAKPVRRRLFNLDSYPG
jgi:hypothetical protein